MELTTQQIQNLYAFTRKHYVEHYDIQTELVDHLANDIEQMLQEKPTLTFEQARDNAFKKFGRFGFSEIVSKRESALAKKYNKILWRFAKKWFQIPKILTTITLFFGLYVLLIFFPKKIIILFILLLFFSFYTLYKAYKLRQKQKIRFQKTGKKWMLEEKIFVTAGANIGLLHTNFINLFNTLTLNHSNYNTIIVLIVCLFLTLTIICTYIILEVIPKQSEKLLAEYYPEYSILG